MNINVQEMKDKAMNMFNSSNKLNILWIVIILALFSLLSYYVYVTYIYPVINKKYEENDEFYHKGNDPRGELVAELYLMHASWCPHSKKILPVWNELKEKYTNNKINNYDIIFREYEESQHAHEMEEFQNKYLDGIAVGAEGNSGAQFPTIYLIKENEIVEFKAKITKENLNEFIQSILV